MEKSKRKELMEEYKQIKTYMGVAQIKNEVNGKIFVCSFTNMKNKWLTTKMSLNTNMHVNAELQKDWNELGENAFSYAVLEEKDTEKVLDKKLEARAMEKEWIEKLQPFGEKGYNKPIKD